MNHDAIAPFFVTCSPHAVQSWSVSERSRQGAMDSSGITNVGHAIQLSVAPVFLLSGIGAMLAVMTNRLARIVDRARALEARIVSLEASQLEPHHANLRLYSRRAQLINRAITFCTITACLICAVVVTLFVGAFYEFNAPVAVAA